MTTTGDRLSLLHHWLENDCNLVAPIIAPIAGDASFRRYYRVFTSIQSYIAMDAPPKKEDCQPFLSVTHQLKLAGLHVPHVYAADPGSGFILLGDLGDSLYLHHLNDDTADLLYNNAIEALIKIQAIQPIVLPLYDRGILQREMELFREWFLDKYIRIDLRQNEHKILDKTFNFLVTEALSQPQKFVHRDYHSRNLLVTPMNSPGILDYQDAVLGAVTYDIVSLLKDSYIAWPEKKVTAWALEFRDKIASAKIITSISNDQFLRWFDLMGIQRHLKVCGIFARLYSRDGKKDYLKDIPRTLHNLMITSNHYSETQDLYKLLQSWDITNKLDNGVSV